MLELGGFFTYLVENPARVAPIKTDTRRLLSQLQAPQRRRQAARHTVYQGSPFPWQLASRAALLCLDLLPMFEHLSSVLGSLGCKHVRVPAHHFFVYLADHIRNTEAPLFRGNLRVKHDLQEKISHLFDNFGVLSAFERVQHFVSFLNQVGPKRGVRLLAIPGTRFAQAFLKRHQLLEPRPSRQAARLAPPRGTGPVATLLSDPGHDEQ